MVESDHSNESKEVGDEMSPSEVPNESIKTTGKRQRTLSSEEEKLPTKKSRNSVDKELPASNGSTSNNTNDDTKEEMEQDTNSTNNQKSISSPTNKPHKKSNKGEQENKESSSPHRTNSTNETDDENMHNASDDSSVRKRYNIIFYCIRLVSLKKYNSMNLYNLRV